MEQLLDLSQYSGIMSELLKQIVTPEFMLTAVLTWLTCKAIFSAAESNENAKRWAASLKRLIALLIGGIYGLLVIPKGSPEASVVLPVLYGVIAGGFATTVVSELRGRVGNS